MEYHVEKEKLSIVKSWGIASAIAFIYSGVFFGWIGFFYITFSFFTDTILSTFNFTRDEILILGSNFLLVFVLLLLYFWFKQSRREDVVLNQTGILFNKLNIFLKNKKYDIKWNDLNLIEINRITYREMKFRGYIQFKLTTKDGKRFLLPKQPPDNNTYEFRIALDGFVKKYNPEIKLINL